MVSKRVYLARDEVVLAFCLPLLSTCTELKGDSFTFCSQQGVQLFPSVMKQSTSVASEALLPSGHTYRDPPVHHVAALPVYGMAWPLNAVNVAQRSAEVSVLIPSEMHAAACASCTKQKCPLAEPMGARLAPFPQTRLRVTRAHTAIQDGALQNTKGPYPPAPGTRQRQSDRPLADYLLQVGIHARSCGAPGPASSGSWSIQGALFPPGLPPSAEFPCWFPSALRLLWSDAALCMNEAARSRGSGGKEGAL